MVSMRSIGCYLISFLCVSCATNWDQQLQTLPDLDPVLGGFDRKGTFIGNVPSNTVFGFLPEGDFFCHLAGDWDGDANSRLTLIVSGTHPVSGQQIVVADLVVSGPDQILIVTEEEVDGLDDVECFASAAQRGGCSRSDLNDDGAVNQMDLQLLLNLMAQTPPPYRSRFDQNADRVIDSFDLSHLLNCMGFTDSVGGRP